jgi:hypothetical protein
MLMEKSLKFIKAETLSAESFKKSFTNATKPQFPERSHNKIYYASTRFEET